MTSARALANQEREIQVKRLGRVGKALLLSAATLMTFVTVVLLIADKLYRPDAFVIDQLKIKGQFQYLTPEEVQQVVFAQPIGNYFSIELGEIKQGVEAMAWVQHADVRREWPHTLSVQVREHRPVMRWHTLKAQGEQDGANVAEQWVSARGHIISLDKPLDKHSPITLMGTEHDARELLAQAMQWQKQLAPSGIRVLKVSLSASQAWQLSLSYLEPGNTFELLLGREHHNERLVRFQSLFDKKFKHAPEKIIRVDARYPDGLAIETQDIPEPGTDDDIAAWPPVRNVDRLSCIYCSS